MNAMHDDDALTGCCTFASFFARLLFLLWLSRQLRVSGNCLRSSTYSCVVLLPSAISFIILSLIFFEWLP